MMKNGNKFEGKILQETPEKVVLKMKFGTMGFPRSQIKEIIKKAAPEAPKPKAKDTKSEPATKPSAGPAQVAAPSSPGEKSYLREGTKVLDIQDAIAVKSGNSQISVTFFGFKLSVEDMKELRLTKNPYELVKKKPSPDRKKWKNHPYLRLDIEFADENKGMVLSNIAEARMCIYATVYKDVGDVLKNGEQGRRVSVTKLDLTKEGEEETLHLIVEGSGTIDFSFGRGKSQRKYVWHMDVTCPVVIRG
ncbi:MAG: hypothetical protein GXP25_10050 [Planctomycetes bacterium]|nr:hypothetical protein [Planctomycetota bacterium]